MFLQSLMRWRFWEELLPARSCGACKILRGAQNSKIQYINELTIGETTGNLQICRASFLGNVGTWREFLLLLAWKHVRSYGKFDINFCINRNKHVSKPTSSGIWHHAISKLYLNSFFSLFFSFSNFTTSKWISPTLQPVN